MTNYVEIVQLLQTQQRLLSRSLKADCLLRKAAADTNLHALKEYFLLNQAKLNLTTITFLGTGKEGTSQQ